MTPGTGDQNFKKEKGLESPLSTIGNETRQQEQILDRTKRLIDQLDAGLKLSNQKMKPFEISQTPNPRISKVGDHNTIYKQKSIERHRESRYSTLKAAFSDSAKQRMLKSVYEPSLLKKEKEKAKEDGFYNSLLLRVHNAEFKTGASLEMIKFIRESKKQLQMALRADKYISSTKIRTQQIRIKRNFSSKPPCKIRTQDNLN